MGGVDYAFARIASHRIASHRIASHRIASHRIASHRIASHRCMDSMCVAGGPSWGFGQKRLICFHYDVLGESYEF